MAKGFRSIFHDRGEKRYEICMVRIPPESQSHDGSHQDDHFSRNAIAAMRVVSGKHVPALDRAELAEAMSVNYSPGHNLCIFTGDTIIIQRGEAKTESILPRGVAGNVKKVHRTHIYDQMVEAIRVEFNNGNCASLLLNLGIHDPIDDEDLTEFRATCLLLHDL